MSTSISRSSFIGDTQACFDDLVSKHPQLSLIELLAEFCQVTVPTVQIWQREKKLPGGAGLLSVRCFLTLAGYEVTEIQELQGDAKQLARIVGLRLIEPEVAAERLGYKSKSPLHSLWRVTLTGSGFTSEVRKKMANLHRSHKKKLEDAISSWQSRIVEVIGEGVVAPKEPVTSQESLTPAIVVAFGRSVAATIAIARVLTTANQASAARDATAGGSDMHELIGLLQELTG